MRAYTEKSRGGRGAELDGHGSSEKMTFKARLEE